MYAVEDNNNSIIKLSISLGIFHELIVMNLIFI